jgi:hypothetical protein
MWLLCNLSFARELSIFHFMVCTQEPRNFMCKSSGLNALDLSQGGFIFMQLRKDDSNVAVDKVLRELLGSNAKMSGKIGGTIETRVQDRVLLLDNPATQGGAVDRAKNKAHRSRSKRSSKHLSLRQHRHLGSFNLPIEYQKQVLAFNN